MSITLYSATVPAWLQVLHSISGLLDKAEAFCAETGLAPDELIQARLADDMLPFAYQIRATTTHSLGALEALRAGVIHPDRSAPPATMVALRELVGRTIVALEAVDAEDLNSYVGKDMRFDAGALVLDFVPRTSCCRLRNPISIFTLSLRMTSFGHRACRSASAIILGDRASRRDRPDHIRDGDWGLMVQHAPWSP